MRSLHLQTFFGFIGEYITPLLTLAKGVLFCPLLMPMSEAFSISLYFNKTFITHTHTHTHKRNQSVNKTLMCEIHDIYMHWNHYFELLFNLLTT